MQDLNDLLYFAEVVDRGGFAAAGRALGIPKSRLSRRVAELEARLGVRLLQRSTRKLSLTAVGEQYHRHCVAMRENALAADEAVAHAQTEPRGTVRVACPVTLAQTTLGPILPQFLARYPLVTVDMQVSNRVVDLIEEGIDVALRVRQSLDDSGSLVVKNFGATRSLLVAGPAQLARQGTPRSVADLQGMDTVAMSAPAASATADLGAAASVIPSRPASRNTCWPASSLASARWSPMATSSAASSIRGGVIRTCSIRSAAGRSCNRRSPAGRRQAGRSCPVGRSGGNHQPTAKCCPRVPG